MLSTIYGKYIIFRLYTSRMNVCKTEEIVHVILSVQAREYYDTSVLHPFFSCSKKTNSRTVLGPRRINAGVHPMNRNRGPSCRREVVNT